MDTKKAQALTATLRTWNDAHEAYVDHAVHCHTDGCVVRAELLQAVKVAAAAHAEAVAL